MCVCSINNANGWFLFLHNINIIIIAIGKWAHNVFRIFDDDNNGK